MLISKRNKTLHSKEYNLELVVEAAGGEIVKAGSVVSSTKDQVVAIIIATSIINIFSIMTVTMIISAILLIILLLNFPSTSSPLPSQSIVASD